VICVHNSGRTYSYSEVEAFQYRGNSDKPDRIHLGLGLNIAVIAFSSQGGACELRPASTGGVDAICRLPYAVSLDHPPHGSTRTEGSD